MLIRNNEIHVRRGESWTLSRHIKNKDGSPYIISSELTNPYWLVTVTSNIYQQENRYVLNKWLNLSHFARFRCTEPVNIQDYGYGFTSNTLPSGFEGNKALGYANVAVFYEKNAEGVTLYKYWEYNNNEDSDYSGQWVDYKCPVITSFSREITSEWTEHNYYYSISLVSGRVNTKYTEGDEPIIIDDLLPILSNTSLYVKSNLKGE